MSLTFAQLKSESRAILFADGEAENLIEPHNRFFNDALWDLSKSITCYRIKNLNVFPHCSTYFNCGLTVLPAPTGCILPNGVYVIGKNSDDSLNWCSKRIYQQVEYCHIERFVKLARTCRNADDNSILAAALAVNIFGCGWRTKYQYPCPTDEGFESLPALPQGFHYPQSSTDAGGRSRGGVWALHSGRIYIAPWIESSEAVVIEWTGIKTQWADSDLVEEDAKFRQAVRLNVNMQHHMNYEQDQQKLNNLRGEWREALRDLIDECRQQTRKRDCSELGAGENAARGIGASNAASALFYNEFQTFTASCPVGQTGTQVTSTVAAGQVGSALSVADANARALAQATADATSRLVCTTTPTVYLNTVQTFTAYCAAADGNIPAATGIPSTVTIQPGTFSSNVSQAAADAAALAAATELANSRLSCTFHNAPQSYTAICPSNHNNTNTVNIPAGGFSGASQSAADDAAKAAAQSQAVSGLTGCVDGILIGNTAQSVNLSGTLVCPAGTTGGSQSYNIAGIIPANTYTAITSAANQAVTQLALNQQALTAAQGQAQGSLLLLQNQFYATCRRDGGRNGFPGGIGL